MKDSFAEGGFMYDMLTNFQNRLALSFGMTLVMLVVATIVSVFVANATVLYLAILFGPGALTLFFGHLLPRKHWTHGLSTNQRLAIERYRSADEATKKLFPEGFEETVRNAKAGPGPGKYNDQYQLAVAAQKLLDASAKRAESLNLRDDKVEVALTFMQQGVESLEVDTEAHKEIYGPKTIKRMVGRQIVEEPNPFYGRVQDR